MEIYTDVNGKLQEVRGDMTKIRFVPGLSSAAKRLLQNIEHTSRKLPGTGKLVVSCVSIRMRTACGTVSRCL